LRSCGPKSNVDPSRCDNDCYASLMTVCMRGSRMGRTARQAGHCTSARIGHLSPAEVEAHLLAQDAALVDVRESEELDEHGWIAGSIHLPRGLLEVRADPASPMHRPELDPQWLTISTAPPENDRRSPSGPSRPSATSMVASWPGNSSEHRSTALNRGIAAATTAAEDRPSRHQQEE